MKIKKLYIEQNFFYALIAIVLLFAVSFLYTALFGVVKIVLLSLFVIGLLDIVILFFAKQGIQATRVLPEKFSNGDKNPVEIHIKNHYTFPIFAKIIDEIPFQFQKRDFLLHQKIKASANKAFKYELRPTERGEFWFGKLIIYAQSPLRLISRRFDFEDKAQVATYPSFMQLKKFDLMAMAYRNEYGIKKIRRIGHTMEFEQIKEYVLGDDIRTINWKATAKRNQLMINQFQDEKSQPIYSIIDKGRVMKMPFNGLSLLDYAINSTLVMSNVTIKKHDKAGMLCFSKKVENRVAAERRSNQMNLILETLYKVQTDYKESDYGRLYADLKRNVKQRSLLFLYTNFETLDGLDRQLAYLQGIAKSHVLVVIFFINTELEKMVSQKSEDIQDIYQKTIAEKFIYEKRLIVKELKRRGVYSILTKPGNLTVNVINKYLEFKAKGVI